MLVLERCFACPHLSEPEWGQFCIYFIARSLWFPFLQTGRECPPNCPCFIGQDVLTNSALPAYRLEIKGNERKSGDDMAGLIFLYEEPAHTFRASEEA